MIDWTPVIILLATQFGPVLAQGFSSALAWVQEELRTDDGLEFAIVIIELTRGVAVSSPELSTADCLTRAMKLSRIIADATSLSVSDETIAAVATSALIMHKRATAPAKTEGK